MNEYFTSVNEKLDSLSDEDFDKLLLDSGLGNCPYATQDMDEKTIEVLSYSTKHIQHCELCNDKRDVYAYYGGDVNFCPKCGRIL